MDTFLNNHSLMELQCILIEEKETEEYKKTNKFSPLKMKGGFLHECTELMPNEEFYDFKEFPEIKASKNGRIMHKGKIIPQEPENNENRYDYLWVNVPGYKYIKVYELVAKTFLLSNNPDPAKYRIIHHINNNGFDNRVINLMYVTCEQHRAIHMFGSWYCGNTMKNNLCDQDCYYYNRVVRKPQFQNNFR